MVVGVREVTRGGPRGPLLERVLVVVASLAALVSAVGGAFAGLPELDEWRRDYGAMPESLRDDPIAVFLGFDDDVWETLRQSARKGDRYAVVARGERRFEVRNYAAFSLLPAIQVLDPADADVVIYYQTDPPAGSRCRAIGDGVCLLRREPT